MTGCNTPNALDATNIDATDYMWFKNFSDNSYTVILSVIYDQMRLLSS
jgi:hypothetical protein